LPFDNVLYQSAVLQISADLKSGTLPRSLLFAGAEASGKLTTALELARVLNCADKGAWRCECPSCKHHKALVSGDLLLAGPRTCILEIEAAKKAYLEAQTTADFSGTSGSSLALSFLFQRAVRKLTARFNPVLWEGDDKLTKAAPLLTSIDEKLEELGRAFSEKTLDALAADCAKLENQHLYDSLPVDQVRNAASWARYTQASGTRVVIIENADRLQESVRNALLKILEEPPEQALFVLTTTRRQAVMPTILSRCRCYAFDTRSPEQNRDILKRIFHVSPEVSGIDEYFHTFLPVPPEDARRGGQDFLTACLEYQSGPVPVPGMTKFEPKLLLQVFFQGMYVDVGPYRRQE
jgi:DNA polymerase-3 subunit gamma/tau